MALLICGLLVGAIPATILLWLKGTRVAEARGGRWGLVRWLGVIALVAALAGPVMAVVGLQRAFGTVASVDDPSTKSERLSEGIGLALDGALVPLCVAVLLYTIGFFLVGYGAPEGGSREAPLDS